MLKLKHILSVFLLAVTTLVAAQTTYVIDSVCVGADRTYRINGEKGSTYDWFIRDAGTDVANPSYVDFSTINSPADTTWGSEVTYNWSAVGLFDIVTFHYSEHGCDTLEQGQVKVFELPQVEAGSPDVLCTYDDIQLIDDAAWNYSAIYWETRGDGTFSSNTTLHPIYSVGATDQLDGEVTLILTAFGLADNSSCTPVVDSVTFRFSRPDVNLTVNDLLCFNSDDASITPEVTGGTPPYAFAWTGPDGFTSSDSVITNLKGGWYKVNVTDANSCVIIDSAEISSPPEILVSIDEVRNISCFGGNDGYIFSHASGGTGNLSVQWEGRNTGYVATDDSISNLVADTYIITVTDENACEVIDSVEINQPEQLLALIADIPGMCENEEIQLQANGSGGVLPYNYAWSGDGSIYLDFLNSDTPKFINPPAGAFNLYFEVTDANNCSAIDSVVINVTPPVWDTMQFTVCENELPYSWGGVVFAEADTITRTVFSTEGCDTIRTFELTVDPLIHDTLQFTVCANYLPITWRGELFEDADTIIQNIEGTVGCDTVRVLELHVEPMINDTMQLTVCANELPYNWQGETFNEADTTSITVSAATGCDTVRVLQLQVEPLIEHSDSMLVCENQLPFTWYGQTFNSASTITFPVVASSGCDTVRTLKLDVAPLNRDTATLTICENQLPYEWYGQTFNNADTIRLDVVASVGCDTVRILQLQTVPEITDEKYLTVCESDLPYVWFGETFTGAEIRPITVFGPTCDTTRTLHFEVSPLMVTTSTIENITCFGDGNGTIDLEVSGGIAPFEYLWSNGQITQDLDNLVGGEYSVIITDSLGCSITDTFRIEEPTEILLAETHVDQGTSKNPIGSIDLIVSGGTPFAVEPFYTYEWVDSTGAVVGTTEDLAGLYAGQYTVTVTDANNCTNELTIDITRIIVPDEGMQCIDDLVLSCYEDLAAHPIPTTLAEYMAVGGVTVYSHCGLRDSTFTYVERELDGPDCYNLERIFTVETQCDSLMTCRQLVSVIDTELPTMTCPDNVMSSDGVIPLAYADYNAYLSAGGTADDNCGVIPSTFRLVSESQDGMINPLTVVRTYEIEDYCGNVQSCEQTIEVFVDKELAIICPSSPVPPLQCLEEEPAAFASVDEFEAAGGLIHSSPYDVDESTFKLVEEVRSGLCPLIITRTYGVKNTNGDSTSCSHIITIHDKIAPEAVFAEKTVTCNSMPPVYSTVEEARSRGNSISDNCAEGGDNTLTITLLTTDYGVDICPQRIVREYEITDGCGNSTIAQEVIYRDDNVAPVILSGVPDLTADCEMPPPYENYLEFYDAGGNVMEDCGNFFMEFRGITYDNPRIAGVAYYNYRFSDPCNNYVDYRQKVTVLDIEPPVFTQLPDTITVDCEPELFASWSEFVRLGGMAEDNCQLDTSSFALVSSVPNGTVCPITYNNTYEIYDVSSNRADTVHVVVVVDDQKPVLACPPTDTIEIADPMPGPFVTLADFLAGGGTVDENCEVDPATWEIVSSETSSDACAAYATYTYRVADYCGNWSEVCSHRIIKGDVLAPDMVCAANQVVSCLDEIPAPYTTLAEFRAGGGTVNDASDLDIASFTMVGEEIIGTNCPLEIIRTYSIADVCGNQAACSQTFILDDSEVPVIACPPDVSGECLSEVTVNVETLQDFYDAGGTLTDNCGIDTFMVERQTNTLESGVEILTTYSAEDYCGNRVSCVQRVVLSDDIAPDAVCNDITVQLDENGNYVLTDIDMRTIAEGSSDNCTAFDDLQIEIDITAFTCADVEAGKVVNVVVTDEVGNSSSCVANITVLDSVPPVALCNDLTVYLDETGLTTITTAMVDNGSSDNCQLDSLIISKDTFTCADAGENWIVLRATDIYGNADTCNARITVVDQIPPYITCLPKQTVQLGPDGTLDIEWRMVADSVYDECLIDTVLLDKYTLTCDDIGNTFITATAYDMSGNSSECQAEFEIFGNVAPNVENDTAVTAINIPVEINVVQNDYDLKTSINVASLGIEIDPANGSVQIDKKTGIVTYTPNDGFVGSDVFRYSICDDAIPCKEMCGDALVFISVRAANNPPVAVNDTFGVPCGDLTANVLLNDYDPDGDEIRAFPVPITRPTNGVLTLFEDGNFEYIPFVDFVGVDSFQYEIKDLGAPPTLYDTAWVYITRVADNDCDGIADIDDIDDDNDGILDVVEGDGEFDSDQDGIPDSWDIDSDDDGILDNIEAQGEHNYIEPDGWRDDNNNGWDDRYDSEEGGYPFVPVDTDGDGVPDFLDIDSDNDGVFDFIEGHDANSDGIPDVTRYFGDLDGDGLDDAYDEINGWGIPDLIDNETASNAPLQDFDGDGTRDWRDTNDEDDEHLTYNEDINGDGDYSNDDLDLDGRPEYLDTENVCELFIPEGFSPNDDGVHDFFQILCIYPRYPDAKLMIFNRNGQKIFEKENYGNFEVWGWNDAWWWGTSEGVLTLGRSGGLPAGNYIYILELNDGSGDVRNGTVMVAY